MNVVAAGFWKRAGSFLFDLVLIIGPLSLAIDEAISFFVPSLEGGLLPLIFELILELSYFTWFHYFFGKTLGKKVFKLRVMNVQKKLSDKEAPDRRIRIFGEVIEGVNDGYGLSLKSAFLRVFAFQLSALPLGAGLFMALFQKENRALHDLIMGTVVVDESSLQ